MAVMNTKGTSSRQTRLAEQVVGYETEQRRLKAAAAGRRAAAASRAAAGEETGHGFAARRTRPRAASRSSQYLR